MSPRQPHRDDMNSELSDLNDPGRYRAAFDEPTRWAYHPGRNELSPRRADEPRELQYAFRRSTGTERDESQALVLRLSYAPRPTVRSRRRARTGRRCGTAEARAEG
jgi:hypothetical protein